MTRTRTVATAAMMLFPRRKAEQGTVKLLRVIFSKGNVVP